MNKILKLLPALALVLAATLAFAFSPKQEATGLYGHDSAGWYDVTNVMPGPATYTCDNEEDQECLFDNIEGSPVNPGEDKVFTNRGLTPIP